MGYKLYMGVGVPGGLGWALLTRVGRKSRFVLTPLSIIKRKKC